MTKLKVASTQFDLRRLSAPEEFWQRVEGLAKAAATEGAQVLQYPEYFALSWLGSLNGDDFAKALDGFAAVEDEFHRRFATLSKETDQAICAGTVPMRLHGRRVNRSFIYLPDGRRLFQDKQNMTRFEDEEWSVQQGDPQLPVFKWKGATVGVAICYDIEFPDYAKALMKKDVDLILVPSCTDDVHGYWRVRHTAQSRAVEGQTYVVMSSIVGGNPKHPEIDVHYGRAGFFTPCDKEFPEEGVLAQGTLNQEGVSVATLDMSLIERVRINGTVLNRRDNK